MTAPPATNADQLVSLFDRSARLRMEFTGAKAAESLTGLVTNDVLSLKGGDGLYACALTAKGRVISDVRILALAGDGGTVTSFLADANAAGGAGFAAMIRKYVNPRLAKYVDVSHSTACLTLDGLGTLELLRTLGADDSSLREVASGPHFTHRAIAIADVPARLVRVPDLGAQSTFDLHLQRDAVSPVMAALLSAGAVAADDTAWHQRRVFAGRPEWGQDMDETTLAQEANMDALQAISYQKGCYTGQETVARVHFRGHVNRTLRRVEYDGAEAPVIGTPMLSSDAAQVGDARSSAATASGARMGIAMLRREVTDGARLTWLNGAGESRQARVIGDADAS
jgi:tRNA-modifying protein YgfZ